MVLIKFSCVVMNEKQSMCFWTISLKDLMFILKESDITFESDI